MYKFSFVRKLKTEDHEESSILETFTKHALSSFSSPGCPTLSHLDGLQMIAMVMSAGNVIIISFTFLKIIIERNLSGRGLRWIPLSAF